MSKRTWILMTAGILLLAPAAGADAESARTLAGEYYWSDTGVSGELEAIFTATDEGRWEVAFHFDFRGQSRVFAGTAVGSLSDGELSGTVKDDTKKRTFTFSGEFAEGSFSGTHAEIGKNGEHRTGTLKLGGQPAGDAPAAPP